jgi:hypothetical protein
LIERRFWPLPSITDQFGAALFRDRSNDESRCSLPSCVWSTDRTETPSSTSFRPSPSTAGAAAPRTTGYFVAIDQRELLVVQTHLALALQAVGLAKSALGNSFSWASISCASTALTHSFVAADASSAGAAGHRASSDARGSHQSASARILDPITNPFRITDQS